MTTIELDPVLLAELDACSGEHSPHFTAHLHGKEGFRIKVPFKAKPIVIFPGPTRRVHEPAKVVARVAFWGKRSTHYVFRITSVSLRHHGRERGRWDVRPIVLFYKQDTLNLTWSGSEPNSPKFRQQWGSPDDD